MKRGHSNAVSRVGLPDSPHLHGEGVLVYWQVFLPGVHFIHMV